MIGKLFIGCEQDGEELAEIMHRPWQRVGPCILMKNPAVIRLEIYLAAGLDLT